MADSGGEKRYAGEWWMAGSDHRVGGELTIGSDILLKTVRPLHSATERRHFTDATILGESRGSRLTLLHCWSGRSRRNMSTGLGDVETHPATVLIGRRHLGTEEDHKFDRARFRVTNLDAWAGREPFSEGDGPDSTDYTLHFTTPPLLTASLPDAQISLGRPLSVVSTGTTTYSLDSFEEMTVELEQPLSLRELRYQYIDPVVQLLDLATDHPCEPLSIQVANSKVDGRTEPLWLRALYPNERRFDEGGAELRQRMPFSLSETTFETLIPQWFEIEKQVRPVCDTLFSLRNSSRYYLQNLAFSAAAAAEGLHVRLNPGADKNSEEHQERLRRIYAAAPNSKDRKWLKYQLKYSHNFEYADRLRDLIATAGPAFEPYIGSDPERWIVRVKKYRNIVAHAGEGRDEDLEVVALIAQTVQLLLRIVLLKQLGFTDDQCKSMTDRVPHWRSLRDVLPRDAKELFVPTSPPGV
jgi:hypothetical protein